MSRKYTPEFLEKVRASAKATPLKRQSIFDEWLNEGYTREWLDGKQLLFEKEDDMYRYYYIQIDATDWSVCSYFNESWVEDPRRFMTYEELDRVYRTIKALKEDIEAND